MMAVGVASASEHGQNTTRIVTPRISPVVHSPDHAHTPKHVSTARASDAGTRMAAHLSAMRWTGAFLRSASFTRRIIFWSDESSPAFVTRIVMAPNRLIVPEYTSSPTALSTGSDSPVITLWSTVVVPSVMTPSTGIVSPGKTRTSLPTSISEIGRSLKRIPCARHFGHVTT